MELGKPNIKDQVFVDGNRYILDRTGVKATIDKPQSIADCPDFIKDELTGVVSNEVVDLFGQLYENARFSNWISTGTKQDKTNQSIAIDKLKEISELQFEKNRLANRWLVFTGGIGTGKSFLCASAIGHMFYNIATQHIDNIVSVWRPPSDATQLPPEELRLNKGNVSSYFPLIYYARSSTMLSDLLSSKVERNKFVRANLCIVDSFGRVEDIHYLNMLWELIEQRIAAEKPCWFITTLNRQEFENYIGLGLVSKLTGIAEYLDFCWNAYEKC
jgi:DNA replication protein DnaC